jgi:hypothetical protein
MNITYMHNLQRTFSTRSWTCGRGL